MLKNKAHFVFLAIIINVLFSTNLIAVCFDNIPFSNQNSDYIANVDGTVIDKKTNLMWVQCTQGLSGNNCAGIPTTFTWGESLLEAENSEFAGFNDWRVPNIKELRSIIEHSCFSPSINSEIFPNTRPWFYWSATPDSKNTNHSWRIDFNLGTDFLYGREGFYFLRLVRTH